jgi:tRNA A-37 threonylcarbamoyl transferase component Bud32
MEVIDLIMQWIVAPIAAFVWVLYSRVNKHGTDIEVIKATSAANKEAHDREFKEMRESFRRVFEKLDNIEQALRK